jgi:hypothetical protein
MDKAAQTKCPHSPGCADRKRMICVGCGREDLAKRPARRVGCPWSPFPKLTSASVPHYQPPQNAVKVVTRACRFAVLRERPTNLPSGPSITSCAARAASERIGRFLSAGSHCRDSCTVAYPPVRPTRSGANGKESTVYSRSDRSGSKPQTFSDNLDGNR